MCSKWLLRALTNYDAQWRFCSFRKGGDGANCPKLPVFCILANVRFSNKGIERPEGSDHSENAS